MVVSNASITSQSAVLLVPLRFVGDTVLTLPMAAHIKAAFAAAGEQPPTITMLCSPATASLAQAHPAIDTVIVEADDWPAKIKAGPFTHACIFRKSATMAHRCKVAGIPVRVGYDMQRLFAPIGFQRWGLHLTYTAPYPPSDTRIHQVIHHWGVIKAVGLSVPNPGPPTSLSLHTTEADKVAMAALADTQPPGFGNKPVVVFHTASASASKQLPLAVFTPALQWLGANGFSVMATGLAQDREGLDDLAHNAGVLVWNVAGQTTLTQLPPLLQQAVAYVGVDSGPLHMAAAAGVRRFVALYGPTNAEQWGPYGVGVQATPVFYTPADTTEAMATRLQQAVTMALQAF